MPEEKKIPSKNLPLEEIIKKCMDSEGYVIFVARLTNELIKETGQRVIEYDYRRYQFAFEDVKNALIAFKEHFLKDINTDLL